MFLQLAVVFSLLLSTLQQVEKECGSIILGQERKVPYNATGCTSASQVYLLNNKDQPTLPDNLASLQEIKTDTVTSSYYISLRIEYSYVPRAVHTMPFLPSLRKIIPYPNKQRAAIFIRNNFPFCINDADRKRLLDMVNGQGYIQECTCVTAIKGNITQFIGGPKCRTNAGGILFLGGSIMTETLRRQLETVTMLRGIILINGTNFTSLDFLKNLRTIIYSGKETAPAIEIVNNPYLKSLGFMLDYILPKRGEPFVNRRNSLIFLRNNPMLKLSPPEMEHFQSQIETRLDIMVEKNPVKFVMSDCQLVYPLLKNTATIQDCTDVTGDLVIDESFRDVSAQRMEELFGYLRVLKGCLLIKNTNFKDIMFLHNLVTIKCMEHRPAITIENNPELQWLNVQISDFGDSLSILTFKITNNRKLCYREVDYLKSILDSPWRVIEFDRWKAPCHDVKKLTIGLLAYHAIAAGILVVGIVVLEVILRAMKRRRSRATGEGWGNSYPPNSENDSEVKTEKRHKQW